jgi:putative glutamine amidotransferase
LRTRGITPVAPITPTTVGAVGVSLPLVPVVAAAKPLMLAPVATSSAVVGGQLVAAALDVARVPGRTIDVLLPAGTTLAQYVAALTKSGAFPEQQSHLQTLASLTPSAPAASSPAGRADDRRPTIGIVLSEPMMLVPGVHKNTEVLIALIEDMGCRPVLIPPCADLTVTSPKARQHTMAAMAKALDGLMGPGGADVDPSIYNEHNTASLHTNPLRDRFEADFTRIALDGDLFAFGICRSHQLWNAAAGGSLIQDVESEDVVSVSHKEGHHPVTIEKGSMLFEAVRQQWLKVNSFHHQAVDLAGWGFRAVAHVHDDKTGKSMIEATERWNGITTQFHPELMQEHDAHHALTKTLGRRAHIFAAIKSMSKPTLHDVLQHVRNDSRYNRSDIDWVNRELSRRLTTRP